MATIRRILAGRQAKKNGERAEDLMHREALRDGWTVIKLPMGAKMLSRNKMIRVRTDFDFVFVKAEKVVFTDSKTTKLNSFTYSMITDHQVNKLKELEGHGHKAGYIVIFSSLKKIVFFGGTQLWCLRRGESLKPSDGILLGNTMCFRLNRLFGLPEDTRVLYSGPVPSSEVGA